LYIYSAIFVPKITGIGQLLLKLSLVVGWYPFLRHSVHAKISGIIYDNGGKPGSHYSDFEPGNEFESASGYPFPATNH